MFHFLSQIAEDQAMVETINSKEKDQNSRINTVVNKLIILYQTDKLLLSNYNCEIYIHTLQNKFHY